MRIAFTIVLNGLHHLLAGNQAHFIAKNFDKWYIAEGVSLNKESTKWCNEMPSEYHNMGRSNDGTWEYLKQLTNEYSNITLVNNILVCQKEYMDNGFWKSKDAQVNACIYAMKLQKFQQCYLYQIDVDEQWSTENIIRSEKDLKLSGCKVGTFRSNYWVGPELVAKGTWGEGANGNEYKRLWKWEGEWFKSHEPPILGDGNLSEIILPYRFNHYAYCYKKDVIFKDKWYGGHSGIYKRWEWLQDDTRTKSIGYIWPISVLLDPNSYWGKTDTYIIKVGDYVWKNLKKF